jgi:cytochrome c-type biogenesis protein
MIELSVVELSLFFAAGLYVALSPCLFPIMPLTIFRIMSKATLDDNDQSQQPSRIMALQWVILLTMGILVTFLLVMLLATLIGNAFGFFFISNFILFSFILGVLLLLMGIFFLFPQLGEKTYAKIPIPQKLIAIQRDEYNQFDLFLIGFGYSFIAFPCAFPAFGVTLPIVAANANFLFTLAGMSLFALGLFIPYLILVLVTAETRTRAASLLAENFRKIEVGIGILVILTGLILMWPFFGGPALFAWKI